MNLFEQLQVMLTAATDGTKARRTIFHCYKRRCRRLLQQRLAGDCRTVHACTPECYRIHLTTPDSEGEAI